MTIGARLPPGEQPRLPLSVIVTCFNEERNIAPCLRSVAWADEILVVDSFSTDATLARAAPLADAILEHGYETPAKQKNWAIPQARHSWVLILDADERATPELATEIEALLHRGPSHNGYWIYRRNTFLGREMRHGGWENDRVVRFFHRDRSRYPDVRVHEEMQVEGPVGTLRGFLLHHTCRSFSAYAERLERYSTWWAADRADAGRKGSAWSVFVHSTGSFLRAYILRGGFLEGAHGLMVAYLSSYSVFLKHAKLWERTRSHPDPE